jgi:peptidoglycan DL-endopeptidase CwlO
MRAGQVTHFRRRASLALPLIAVMMLAVAAPTTVSADKFDDEIAALQSQASTLQGQIGSLQQQSSQATTQALATQQALAQTQTQLSTAEVQLDAANERLAATTAQLQATQAQLATDRTQLSQLVVNMYMLNSSGTVTRALVDSKSFVDAMSTITSVNQVSGQVKELVTEVHAKADELTVLQTQQQQEQQQSQALVNQLQTLAARQAQEQAQFAQEAASLTGQAGVLVSQLNGVQAQIATVKAEQAAARAANAGPVRILDGALPPFANGPQYDWFPWGQCTWYVASLRAVHWNGDAWQWAYTAAAAGAPEGMSPRAGSIVVFAPGGAYSGFGHVAYVRSVQSGSVFTVDEANIIGLGVIDQRTIYSLSGVEAFIY